MVHSAYDSFEVVNNCPNKIESVGLYGSKLLLACSNGSLIVYAPQSSSSSSPSDRSTAQTQSQLGQSQSQSQLRKEPYVRERIITGFSKRPIVSMEVSNSRELLLCLSDSISLHRLPTLETVAVITKAKGAHLFAWDDTRGFLSFAKHKKLSIFRHDDGGRGFVEVKEYGVPDIVKSMCWCGDNICMGIRKEYVILNTTSGALSDIFPSGRVAPPLVVPLPYGDLLLGKDNIGVFVDQNGKLRQEGRICWSEAPSVVVIHRPYAIASLPRHVEIRSLRAPYPLVQTVVLQSAYQLHQSNDFVIVTFDDCVYGLFPVPLGAQIVQLTASSNFEEALALCKLLPPEDSSHRAAKESSIHIRYGHYLFENKSYEKAMEQFFASQVDMTHVLSLYPSILLPRSLATPETEKVADFTGEIPHPSRALSDTSDDMESSALSHMKESDRNVMLESKKTRYNSLVALVKFLQKKRYSILERATAEGTEEIVSDVVGESDISSGSSRLKVSNKERGNTQISSISREMAMIMDTSLIQALLRTEQLTAALELLKGPNYCDVKICEEFLQKRNYCTVLLELYKCNGMHHEALKLLTQLQESKSDKLQSECTQISKPEAIIDYLKPLCSTDPMLVLEYSMYVLESRPTQTIDLFLSGNIPADLVNSYLKKNAPNMQTTYLELMLEMNENGISGHLQNEMVQIYLSEVLELYNAQSSQNNWDEKIYPPIRKKLLSTLESISGYNPEALLKRLPIDALYEERAIILGKMNQHELALSLYVHKLQVPELALVYCDRVYETGQRQSNVGSPGNIYVCLMQIYLNPQRTTKAFEKRLNNVVSLKKPIVQKVGIVKPNLNRRGNKIAEIEVAEERQMSPSSTDSGRSDGDGDEPTEDGGSAIMIDEVLDLLSRRWDRINGSQALKLLPRKTKLQNLLPFLEPLLSKSSEAHRNFSVVENLRQSENRQVKDDFYKHRRAVVKINNESLCSLCNKKMGTSVFAVYPNRETLVHFVCFRDSQKVKAVAKSSPVRK